MRRIVERFIRLSPRKRLLVVALYLLALALVLLFGNPAHAQAQTATQTPTPTPQATYTPYSFDDLAGTLGIPTVVPNLSLTPRPWYTPTRPVAGAAFVAPTYVPQTPAIGENQAHGFEAISQTNVTSLGAYLAGVAVGFYGWLVANFANVVRALRLFSFLVFFMAVLMALFRRFAPNLASKSDSWRKGEGKLPEKGTGK